MSSLLKDLYSPAFYNRIGDVFAEVIPAFDKKSFIEEIYTPDFENKELKERMRHTSIVLHNFLPSRYPDAVKLIKNIISKFRERGIGEDGLAYMFLPDYI